MYKSLAWKKTRNRNQDATFLFKGSLKERPNATLNLEMDLSKWKNQSDLSLPPLGFNLL